MKKIILLFAVAVVMSACKNFDIEHPNFYCTSVYFANQFPVRTIILGDYLYPNNNDNAFKCVIYAKIGGVYENKHARKISIKVDDGFCDNILFRASNEKILPMPKNYYSLSSENELVISKGEMMGGVEVQLTNAFFEDPLAFKNKYVIPLLITDTQQDVDSVLMGRSREGLLNPDPRIVGDWDIAPKYYTLYCVKYINEYDAVYLHYGTSTVTNATGTKSDSIYKEKYVEYNRTLKLTTNGRNKVQTADIPFRSTVLKGMYQLQLDFDGNNCTISGGGVYTRDDEIDNPDFDPDLPVNKDSNPETIEVTYTTIYRVIATEKGVFVSKLDDPYTSWSNQAHDVINHLKYRVVIDTTDDPELDTSLIYEADETLVFQLRDVVFEEYSPVLAPQTP